MKKSLIALAVLGLSGAAMAQSSVTLYGVADAGLGQVKFDNYPLSGSYGKIDGKTHFIGAGLMNNGDSRLGVRGTEDLGGGMSAGFNFEAGLNLGTGAQTAAGLSQGFWQRQANMWLSGGWGTVKLGRQFTPSYLAASTYELTSMANYTVLGNTYQFLGVLDRRAPSAFAYVSPTFSGVTAAVGYVRKYDAKAMATVPGLPAQVQLSKDVWDVAVLYGNGPIAAGLGINKVGNSKTNYQLGGKYSFGDFALAASYTQASLPEFKLVRRGFGIGGSATFGSFTATLDLTRDTKNEWDWTGNKKKYTNGVVEGKYALSKRTFAYIAYLRLDKTNNWGLGLHHNF